MQHHPHLPRLCAPPPAAALAALAPSVEGDECAGAAAALRAAALGADEILRAENAALECVDSTVRLRVT